jgi:ribosomal protein L37AE/L43A
VLQTFRHKNIGVIFTTPALSFMDRSARILTHTYMETDYIEGGYCYVRPYKFEYSSRMDKIYWKKYRFHNNEKNNNALITLSQLAFGLPEQELIDEYEKAKEKFTGRLNKDVFNELLSIDGKKKEVSVTPCSVCNNKSFYYKKREHSWQCKRCGNVLRTNPFK